MIHTPLVNFRYRGPRESIKLTSQTGGALADVSRIYYSLTTSENSLSVTPFEDFNTDYTPILQKARVVQEFMRRLKYGS